LIMGVTLSMLVARSSLLVPGYSFTQVTLLGRKKQPGKGPFFVAGYSFLVETMVL
jgi:hypothetical protein